MNATEKNKDESFWAILSSAIELDVKKGHLKWTLMDLSRKSRVTRSLIYYYFGRSKIDILREAVMLVGYEIGGFSEERMQMWREGRLADAIIAARGLCDKLPYVANFMIQHRAQPTEIGEAMQAMEQRYVRKVHSFMPSLNEKQIYALWALYWGLCFAPMIDEEVIREAITPLQTILKKT